MEKFAALTSGGSQPGVPWNERRALHEHYRRFEHLLQLHRLTETWIQEIVKVGVEKPAHYLDRGLSGDIVDSLWMLDSFAAGGLNALLDDTRPEDVLGRLERTAWSVQAYTLSRLLDQAKSPERAILSSLLEQSSWKLGREFAENHWRDLPQESRLNMRTVVLTLADTPFFGGLSGRRGEGSPLLFVRATETSSKIDLLHCAHHSPFSEVRNAADSLCGIHGHWVRGFAYGLNPRIVVHCSREGGRCRQLWSRDGAAVDGPQEMPS